MGINYKCVAGVLLGLGLGVTVGQNALAGVDKPWAIQLKASHLKMANNSQVIPALGIAQDTIHISDETIPELDIVYFWTKNWATELVLTVPQKHSVSVQNGAATQLGTFEHLPPTLSMQYHFANESKWTPYLSAGLNYTRFGSVNLNSAAGRLALERDSIGFAMGAGLNYRCDNGMYMNFDVKKITLRSDVYLEASGAKVSEVKPDPLLVGFGVGWRF